MNMNRRFYTKFIQIFGYMIFLTFLIYGFNASATEAVNNLSVTQDIASSTQTQKAIDTPSKPENPYGIGALWSQSDVVIKVVLFILVCMSMGSWYVIITKLVEQSKMLRQGKDANKDFWESESASIGVMNLDKSSPFRYLVDSGMEAIKKHTGLHEKHEFSDWVEMSIHRSVERVQRRLSNGMSLLATVGSTSPFVGLFGTVWGIYHALTAIGMAGQASIDKVAGPVGEALIMTAIGLAVAVPAVLGYNWLLRRNTMVMDELNDFAEELYPVLLSSNNALD